MHNKSYGNELGSGRSTLDDTGLHSPERLQSTLSPKLIDQQGLATLYQALDEGRAICFVSSGVSVTYGRLGWRDLVKKLVESVNLDSKPPEDSSATSRSAREYLKALNITGRSPGDDLQSGRFPAAFQYVESIKDDEPEKADGVDALQREGLESDLRRKVRAYLYDDKGQVFILLDRMLNDLRLGDDQSEFMKAWAPEFTKVTKPSEQRRLLRDPLEPARVPAGLFQLSGEDLTLWRSEYQPAPAGANAAASIQRAQELATRLFDAVGQWIEFTARQGGLDAMANPVRLSPLRRYVLTALWRLRPGPAVEQAVRTAIKKTMGTTTSMEEDPLARAMPGRVDPLLILARDFGIHRYLTTNYDLDLERMMKFRGFETVPRSGSWQAAGQTVSASGLGATAVDAVFRPDHATELIEFAVAPQPRSMHVMHLHGRATEGCGMVVTENDYLEQYLGRGSDADVVADSIDLAFSANTVLFVGNGMSEDDVLRPLRQFFSERTSRHDRAAVAMLPANGSYARQVEESIAIYARYGAHVIHSGVGRWNKEGRAGPDLRWLASLMHVRRHLSDLVDTLGTALDKWPKQGKPLEKLEFELRAKLHAFDIDDRLFLPDGAEEFQRAIDSHMWTTVEDGLLQLMPPDWDEQAGLEGVCADCMSLEVGLLNGVLAVVDQWMRLFARSRLVHELNMPAKTRAQPQEISPGPAFDVKALPEHLRVIKATQAMLAGLDDAFMGAALSRKLKEIHSGWETERRASQRLPVPRGAEGRSRDIVPQLPVELPDGGGSSLQAHDSVDLAERQPIALGVQLHARSNADTAEVKPTAGSLLVPVTDRFFGGAPSQTFREWYRAILEATGRATDTRATPINSSLSTPFDRAGRRVFVLLAPRGVGKGHFLEASKTDRRTGEFVCFSWPKVVDPDQLKHRYAGFMYLNLSFSLEVIWIFDRLAIWLRDRADAMFSSEDNPGRFVRARPIAREFHEAFDDLNDNRIERLRKMLRLYQQHEGRTGRRLLVAISDFSAMFNRRGDPKNAELYRAVTALLGPEIERAPIDFVLICTNNGFPSFFKRPNRQQVDLENSSLDGWRHAIRLPLEHLMPSGVSAKRSAQLNGLIEHLNIHTIREPARPRSGTRNVAGVAEASRIPVNVLHVLREARASNTVAKYFPDVALAIALGSNAGEDTFLGDSEPEPLMVPKLKFADGHSVLAIQRDIIKRAEEGYGEAEKLVDAIPRALQFLGRQLLDHRPSMPLTEEDFDASVMKALDDAMAAVAAERKAGGSSGDRSLRPGKSVDSDFKRLAELTGRNRFLLCLTCAVASEIGWSGRAAFAPARGKPREATLDVATIRDWFVRLKSQLDIDAARDREDRLIGFALHEYQRMHEDAVVPLLWDAEDSTARECSDEALLMGRAGWHLQQRLLWHLAIAGQAIESDVLARSAEIYQLVRKLPRYSTDAVKGIDPRVETVVRMALNLMVRRCLVFRISPREAPPSRPWPPNSVPWRFALHRFMQRALFMRLHAPFVEHSHVDQFGISMWVTQPDDLPRPSRIAVRQIDQVFGAWTGAPGQPLHRNLPEFFEIAWAGEFSDTLSMRMLRAALGIVRSVFSVGVVSRFHDFEESSGKLIGGEGYFEQHRQKVELLIRRGVQKSVLKVTNRSSGEEERQSAFMAEEIVWLYNECGLFYLVEGRLDLAAKRFEMALAMARRQEGRLGRGALWCRIHLNLAVVDIERGRLREARVYLQQIRDVADENPILRVLAQGYLAVVEHYSGNLAVAVTMYDQVIHDLDQYGQSRSVAIFCRHLSDLYRHRGRAGADKAYDAIERSITSATKGGHEDVRQLSRLSRVRLVISGMASQDKQEIQASLDEIERYGQIMGMPRMLADVAFARASHLLRMGETRYATTLARRAISISTANGLKLRQMTSLALLARIYEQRGMKKPSAILLARALEMAEGCDYANLRESAAPKSMTASVPGGM